MSIKRIRKQIRVDRLVMEHYLYFNVFQKRILEMYSKSLQLLAILLDIQYHFLNASSYGRRNLSLATFLIQFALSMVFVCRQRGFIYLMTLKHYDQMFLIYKEIHSDCTACEMYIK